MKTLELACCATVIVLAPFLQATPALPVAGGHPVEVMAQEAAARAAQALQRLGQRLYGGGDADGEPQPTLLALATRTAVDAVRQAVGPNTCH